MLFVKLQQRYCRKLKKCLDQQWKYYRSHDFSPPVKRFKGAAFKHDIKKYAVVELGMAIDACRLSEEETRKTFMLKWGDVFGFDCHDFEQIMSKLVVRQNSITPFLDKLTLGFEKTAAERLWLSKN
jgi:hypothetical protein